MIRARTKDRQLELYFPMFRNKLLTFFALIFGAGFGFATIGITTFWGSGILIRVITGLFSLPFALVAIFASIAAIYLPLNKLKITIGKGTIRIRRRLFLLPIFIKTVRLSDIHALSIKRTGSTGQGSSQVVHYKITMHTTIGDSYTISEDIDTKGLANQFKGYL